MRAIMTAISEFLAAAAAVAFHFEAVAFHFEDVAPCYFVVFSQTNLTWARSPSVRWSC